MKHLAKNLEIEQISFHIAAEAVARLNLRLQSRQAELIMIRSQTELAKLKGGVIKDMGETVKKTSDAAANESLIQDPNL
ncbi:MAG: hypothetical protein KGQ89_10055 [Verrucomicrobia bacterium]|nr:hypothetical protein [Verrucomicrobiota bacterium]